MSHKIVHEPRMTALFLSLFSSFNCVWFVFCRHTIFSLTERKKKKRKTKLRTLDHRFFDVKIYIYLFRFFSFTLRRMLFSIHILIGNLVLINLNWLSKAIHLPVNMQCKASSTAGFIFEFRNL